MKPQRAAFVNCATVSNSGRSVVPSDPNTFVYTLVTEVFNAADAVSSAVALVEMVASTALRSNSCCEGSLASLHFDWRRSMERQWAK